MSKVVVYTDAARDDYVSGIGYTINGAVDKRGRRVLKGNYTSMEAEFHALVEGVRVASIESSDRTRCEAYTDAKPLTTKMRTPDSNCEDWRDRRRSFHWLANKFDSWELNYTARSHNSDAHELAREALFEGRGESYK